VVATDVNPRALTLATLTFALNEIQVTTRLGSLYEPVADQRFDLITTNPPFVISPESRTRLVYRETEHPCDTLMQAVVEGAAPLLNPGGSLHVIGNWAHIRSTSWQDRVSAWIPPGCDAFVVQREVLDIYEYIEIWLADAGLRGKASYGPSYERWLAYFDELGIEAIGMGWITMVKSGSSLPTLRCEEWAHPVFDHVAEDLMAHLEAMPYAAWSDRVILDHAWVLAPDTVQETTGVPGQAEPSHIALRRVHGLGRAIEVDGALAGVLGACDGELSLGQIVSAVADLTETDATELRADLLPRIQELIAQTWLRPC